MDLKFIAAWVAVIVAGCEAHLPNPDSSQLNAVKPAPVVERSALSDDITLQVVRCWDGVADLPFSDQLAVRLGVTLNSDGGVVELKLIDRLRRPIGSAAMATAIDRAMRAVRTCAPYEVPEPTDPSQTFYTEVELIQ